MGISRMAYQKIEHDDLIHSEGNNQSYFVGENTEEEIIDLFDARNGIELTDLGLLLHRRVNFNQ